MKIGIAMFPTVDAPAPGRLGRMIEDRILAFGDGGAPMIAGIEDDVFDRFATAAGPHRQST